MNIKVNEVLVITDLHLKNEEELNEKLNRILKFYYENKVDLIILAGDIGYIGLDVYYNTFLSLLKKRKVNFIAFNGEHEDNFFIFSFPSKGIFFKYKNLAKAFKEFLKYKITCNGKRIVVIPGIGGFTVVRRKRFYFVSDIASMIKFKLSNSIVISHVPPYSKAKTFYCKCNNLYDLAINKIFEFNSYLEYKNSSRIKKVALLIKRFMSKVKFEIENLFEKEKISKKELEEEKKIRSKEIEKAIEKEVKDLKKVLQISPALHNLPIKEFKKFVREKRIKFYYGKIFDEVLVVYEEILKKLKYKEIIFGHIHEVCRKGYLNEGWLIKKGKITKVKF